MAVPNVFAGATGSIPLSQLDANFNTAITLGNTAVYLGNTTTTFGNVTLTNPVLTDVNSLTGNGIGPGFKNRIINGRMEIDQRNDGASVTPTLDGQYGSCDRWMYWLSQASKFSVQKSTTAPTGFSNSLLITSLSAYSVTGNDFFSVNQKIEGFNFADLMWGTANARTVTLSFWVRSSLTGTFGGAFTNSATNRSYPFSYTISAANTWEQKTVTVTGDTTGTWVGATNGIGATVQFSLGAVSGKLGTAGSWAGTWYVGSTGSTSVVGTNAATFYITGVQLELGSTATSFDVRSYGTELALCQRYYIKISSVSSFLNGYNTTNNYITTNIGLPVQMRITPSTTFTAGTLTNAYEETVVGVAPNQLNWYIRVTATGNASSQGNLVYNATAEL